jgi:hypothetical protein
MCVYVCIYVYVCVYMYVRICMCMYVCMCVFMYVCMYVNVSFFPILIHRPRNLKFSSIVMFPRTTASTGEAVRQSAYCTGGTVNPS